MRGMFHSQQQLSTFHYDFFAGHHLNQYHSRFRFHRSSRQQGRERLQYRATEAVAPPRIPRRTVQTYLSPYLVTVVRIPPPNSALQ